MTRVTRAALCIGLAGATPALATEIDHRAVECVVAGSFPRVDARLTPVDTVVRARVFFRPPTGHNVGADSSGNFSEVWSPGEPNTLRITGTVTATTFDTTLACVSGSGTGSIQASGSGGTYQGRWSFAGQNGTVTVMRLSQ